MDTVAMGTGITDTEVMDIAFMDTEVTNTGEMDRAVMGTTAMVSAVRDTGRGHSAHAHSNHVLPTGVFLLNPSADCLQVPTPP